MGREVENRRKLKDRDKAVRFENKIALGIKLFWEFLFYPSYDHFVVYLFFSIYSVHSILSIWFIAYKFIYWVLGIFLHKQKITKSLSRRHVKSVISGLSSQEEQLIKMYDNIRVINENTSFICQKWLVNSDMKLHVKKNDKSFYKTVILRPCSAFRHFYSGT